MNTYSYLKPVIFTSLTLCACSSFAQTQLGSDIDGEAANNWSGASISMPDATTIAIGAPSNDEVASGAGHVRIVQWNGTSWVQKGDDIDGRSAFDKSGTIVSMPDANTVATGVPGNATSSNPYGRIEVHHWNGSEWVQKGSDINGLSPGERFGYAISMPDENTVAVGAIGGATWASNPSGKVIVYQWNGSDWEQKGSELVGEASGDQFGYTVSMADANTVAVSAPFNDGSSNEAGHVRIYEWTGTSWAQKGGDIDGESGGDNSGWSISMPDANTISIGAPKNSGGGYLNGHTRVYTWNGSSWVQKGDDIDGEAIGDQSGFSVSMPDANNIAIGSPYNSDAITMAGQVRVYSWNGTAWTQNGSDITGEAQDDESGNAVSMPDANTVAIGAYENEGNGNASGHVRVYTLNGTAGVTESTFGDGLTIFPNPTTESVQVELGTVHETVTVSLFSADGRQLRSEHYKQVKSISMDMAFPAGVYYVQLSDGTGQTATVKVVKR